MKELPIPSPGEGQVRIQVAYAPLNPLDTHARADRIKWMHPGFPFVPGYEYSGRVVETGDGVDSALNGKRVAANGQWNGNGEFAIARAAGLVPIPDRFDYQLGSTFSTCAPTSWHLVHSAGRVQPGQTVVLHSAAGAVGIMTTQIAKDAGATVIGLVGGREEGRMGQSVRRRPHARLPLRGMAGAGQGTDRRTRRRRDRRRRAGSQCAAQLRRLRAAGQRDLHRRDGRHGSAGRYFPDHRQEHQRYRLCAVLPPGRTRQAEDAEIEEKLASGQWRIPIERVASLDETPAMHAAFENRELFGRTLIEVGGEDV